MVGPKGRAPLLNTPLLVTTRVMHVIGEIGLQ